MTVSGPELAGFDGQAGPAAHMKIFVPVPGSPDPAMRTYTVRRFAADALELDIDFVLHGNGPAADWAARCRPGDELMVAGPRGTYRPDPAVQWRILAGDESALPAIATILEATRPGPPAQVLAEVAEADGEAAGLLPDGVDAHWLHRAAGAPGDALAAAVAELELPPGDGEIWVGCEASAMRRIRRHLLDMRGLARGALHTRGYWMVGEANHPDHDTGED